MARLVYHSTTPALSTSSFVAHSLTSFSLSNANTFSKIICTDSGDVVMRVSVKELSFLSRVPIRWCERPSARVSLASLKRLAHSAHKHCVGDEEADEKAGARPLQCPHTPSHDCETQKLTKLKKHTAFWLLSTGSKEWPYNTCALQSVKSETITTTIFFVFFFKYSPGSVKPGDAQSAMDCHGNQNPGWNLTEGVGVRPWSNTGHPWCRHCDLSAHDTQCLARPRRPPSFRTTPSTTLWCWKWPELWSTYYLKSL